MKGLDESPHDSSTSLEMDANLLGFLAYPFGLVSGLLILLPEKW